MSKSKRRTNSTSDAQVAAHQPQVGQIVSRDAVLTYLFQGYHKGQPFVMTLKSVSTGTHFTYRLRPLVLTDGDRSMTASIYLDLKTGPEEEHWTWVGLLSWTGARHATTQGALRSGTPTTDLAEQALRSPLALMAGARCGRLIGLHVHEPTVGEDTPSVKGLAWLVRRLNAGQDPGPTAEVWHDGRCCVCRRPLTRPESVAVGIGPDCLEKLGAAAVLAHAARGAA